MAWGERAEEEDLLWGLVANQVPLNPGQHLNDADLVTLKSGQQGVFKPESGERDARPAIPKGSYWRREIAAYRLDRTLGLNLVPTTVPREIEGEQGSFQAFVEDDVRPREEYPAIDQQLMAVLDFLIANSDRHSINWMTQTDGRPAATDNGLSFPCLRQRPTDRRGFLRCSISHSMRALSNGSTLLMRRSALACSKRSASSRKPLLVSEPG